MSVQSTQDDAGTYRPSRMVKRVVGLPGEQIEFDEGDLFVDHRRLQKTPAEFLRVAVLVHDDRFRSAKSDGLVRWVAAAGSNWSRHNDGYVWNNRSISDGQQMLVYRHAEAHLPQAGPYTVYDSYPCNQSLRRELHVVHDLAIEFAVTLSSTTQLAVTCNAIDPPVRATVDMQSGSVELTSGDRQRSIQLPSRGRDIDRTSSMLFGAWDAHCHLVCDENYLELPAGSIPASAGELPPFEFEASGSGTIELSALRLHRDTYFFAETPATWQVPEGHYFLLGDNLPVSIDSRQLGPFRDRGMQRARRPD